MAATTPDVVSRKMRLLSQRPLSMRLVMACVFLVGALVSHTALAMSDSELASIVAQRLHGDRTGACMAVAVIQGEQVARTFACANDAERSRIGPDSAFEIGSVTKTMTGTLLAQMIVNGTASLDDRLSDWLPKGTQVPSFQGAPILLRHVVTHTSGLPVLPPKWHPSDQHDPYADLDETTLLASLADVKLSAAPGTHFAYSNFAMMVLSDAIARRAGVDYETLLKRELFEPLGMGHAYVNIPSEGTKPAQGHTPNHQPVPAWHFQTNLAGVGGVRATLDDMVHYVQGELGRRQSSMTTALQLTQQAVSQRPAMGINWMRMSLAGHTVLTHEGGTAGFSSFVAFDPQLQRGVVILSDTTWNSLGSLGSLGLHLVDAQFPLGKPRHEVTADPQQLAALVGDYELGGSKMRLLVRDGQLVVQQAGQPELVMGHDDVGDYYPRTLDAVLRPEPSAHGMTFHWLQGGGSLTAVRLDAAGAGKSEAPVLTPTQLAEYVGIYRLLPSFALKVAVTDGALTVQGTGQAAIAVEVVGRDQFSAPLVGAQFQFERNDAGKVVALILRQNGQVLRGDRQ